MKDIYINKDLLTGNSISSEGILVYIALRMLMSENISLFGGEATEDVCSLNRLGFLLGAKLPLDRVLLESLQAGITELSDAKLIEIKHDLSTRNTHEYLLELSELRLDTEKSKFVIVRSDEIQTIMGSDELTKKKISLLKYFTVLVGTFDLSGNLDKRYRGKVGHMSIQYVSGQSGVSERTCMRYNEVLEKLNLLYISRSNDKVVKDGQVKQIKNCYSRYSDKDVCSMYAQTFENLNGHQAKVQKQEKKAQSDNSKRMGVLYYKISQGFTYDEKTTTEVFQYVKNENKSIRQEIDMINQKDFLSYDDKYKLRELKNKIRDESVFDRFEFLSGDSRIEDKKDDGFLRMSDIVGNDKYRFDDIPDFTDEEYEEDEDSPFN